MKRRRFLFLGCAAVISLGCTKSDRPIDPVWGKAPCAHCAMLIGDKRFAAQGLLDGDRFFFDDIGCLVLWAEEHKAARLWSHRAEGDGWEEATTTRYASGTRTPMGFDVEVRAGGPLSWDEVRQRVVQKAQAKP